MTIKWDKHVIFPRKYSLDILVIKDDGWGMPIYKVIKNYKNNNINCIKNILTNLSNYV